MPISWKFITESDIWHLDIAWAAQSTCAEGISNIPVLLCQVQTKFLEFIWAFFLLMPFNIEKILMFIFENSILYMEE